MRGAHRCLYFCRRHEQAVKENIHFKKRQSWQKREKAELRTEYYPLPKFVLQSSPHGLIFPTLKRENCEQYNRKDPCLFAKCEEMRQPKCCQRTRTLVRGATQRREVLSHQHTRYFAELPWNHGMLQAPATGTTSSEGS